MNYGEMTKSTGNILRRLEVTIMPTVKKEGLASDITLSVDEILSVLRSFLGYSQIIGTVNGVPVPGYGRWHNWKSRGKVAIDSIQLVQICETNLVETLKKAAVEHHYSPSH